MMRVNQHLQIKGKLFYQNPGEYLMQHFASKQLQSCLGIMAWKIKKNSNEKIIHRADNPALEGILHHRIRMQF